MMHGDIKAGQATEAEVLRLREELQTVRDGRSSDAEMHGREKRELEVRIRSPLAPSVLTELYAGKAQPQGLGERSSDPGARTESSDDRVPRREDRRPRAGGGLRISRERRGTSGDTGGAHCPEDRGQQADGRGSEAGRGDR